MKNATLQNRDWIMLNTLKPHRHKQEQLEKKRPKWNKLTWTWMFTRLDKQTPEVSFVLEMFELLDKLHAEHNLDLAFLFWF